MKKFIIILFFTVLHNAAAQTNTLLAPEYYQDVWNTTSQYEYSYSLSFTTGSIGMAVVNQKKNAEYYLDGSLVLKNTGLSSGDLFGKFLGEKENWENPKNPKFKNRKPDIEPDDVSAGELKNIIRTIDFSFIPIEHDPVNKKVTFLCRYILSVPEKERNSAVVTFHETKITVALDRGVKIDFLNSFFPSDIKYTIIFGANKKSPAVFEGLPKKVSSKRMEKFLEGINSNFSGMKVGFELLRTNAAGNEILLRKMVYPLREETVKNYDGNSRSTLYFGFIKTPLENYNPAKKEYFSELVENRKPESTYQVIALPVKKEGDVYTFRLLIYNYLMENIGNIVQKEIQVKEGEKIKIPLNSNYSGISFNMVPVAMGEPGWETKMFNADTDYAKYVTDYLIFNFETADK